MLVKIKPFPFKITSAFSHIVLDFAVTTLRDRVLADSLVVRDAYRYVLSV